MLNKRFGNIKGAVSDLHRDVTTRRCLTSYDRVEDIVRECVTIKTELDKADDMMDDHKMEFEKRWQQEQLRIKTEQAMFNEQVQTGFIDKPESKSQVPSPSHKGKGNLDSGLVTKILWATTYPTLLEGLSVPT